MIRSTENMSETTAYRLDTDSLQLDFFQAGYLHAPMEGVAHRKSTPFTIVLQVMEGFYDLEHKGKKLSLKPGAILVVPAHQETCFLHHDGPSGTMHARWVHFHYRLHGVADFLSLYEIPLILPSSSFTEATRLLDAAWSAETSNNQPGYLVHQHVIASQLLQLILSASSPREGTERAPGPSRLQPVLRYVQEHMAEPLSVTGLARLASLSPSRFHAVFHSEIGCAPMNYVKTCRLEAAARLLAAGDHTLAVIAEQTGHSDAFHLSHAFKKHFGVAPRTYRKQAIMPSGHH